MTPQVNIPNATSRGVIASLRPPCAQSATLKRGYSASPQHLGQVLVLPSTSEPVIAPANGTVTSITTKVNTAWGHAAGDLDVHKTLEIKFDNGGYISTVIHGLATAAVVTGQYVTRGDTIGTAKTTEIFFQLFYRNSPLDPASYTAFFRGFDGGKVPGKARKLRAGPDFIARVVSDTVSYVMGGIRYFVDKYCSKPPILVSVDFNGDGSKTGLGAVGFGASDFWNVFTPLDFTSEDSYACFYMLNPPLNITELVDEESSNQLSWFSGTMFDTLYTHGPVFEDSGGTTSWFSGTMFETVFIGTGTEAASGHATWLFGSTETVPDIEYTSVDMTWSSGQIDETVVPTIQSDWGTNTASWLDGTMFESVVYAFGSYAPGSGVVYAESAGTSDLTWFSGTLFESVVFAFGSDAPGSGIVYTESAGTSNMAFVSGTLTTTVFPDTTTETTTGTLSFFSGTIIQY